MFSLAVPFLWDERRSRWIGCYRRFGVTYCRYHHGLNGQSEDACCSSKPTHRRNVEPTADRNVDSVTTCCDHFTALFQTISELSVA